MMNAHPLNILSARMRVLSINMRRDGLLLHGIGSMKGCDTGKNHRVHRMMGDVA